MVQDFQQNFVHNFGWRGFLLLFLFALLILKSISAQQPALNLLPIPANIQPGAGSLRIDSSFSAALTGYTEPRLERAGAYRAARARQRRLYEAATAAWTS